MSEETSEIPVSLPAQVLSRFEARVQHSEFESVESYLEFLIEEVDHQLDQQEEAETGPAVDDSEVEDRLRSLGYLNE